MLRETDRKAYITEKSLSFEKIKGNEIKTNTEYSKTQQRNNQGA